jgi:octaprenyl-diphosphate synthase
MKVSQAVPASGECRLGVAVDLTGHEAAARRPAGNAEAALSALADYLADDMLACNNEIIARMQSDVPLIPQLAAHLVAAGGKRLRPLLVFASARLAGYVPGPEAMRHVRVAACVEFIHTATLLHDDVVDNSQLRRGRESANAVFGNKASVLVGDFLFARSFQILTADGSLPVMAILSSTSATLAEGEVLQMTTQNDLGTTVEQYQEVIYGKTAALFAAACECGAVIAAASEEIRAALRAYGAALGMAFQIVDDALDYAADQAELGKTVGDDFREGKVTLPVILAYAAGTPEEQIFWKRTIEDNETQTEEDMAQALSLIARTDAIAATLRKAEDFSREACEALKVLPHGELRSLLEDVAICAVYRHR